MPNTFETKEHTYENIPFSTVTELYKEMSEHLRQLTPSKKESGIMISTRSKNIDNKNLRDVIKGEQEMDDAYIKDFKGAKLYAWTEATPLFSQEDGNRPVTFLNFTVGYDKKKGLFLNGQMHEREDLYVPVHSLDGIINNYVLQEEEVTSGR